MFCVVQILGQLAGRRDLPTGLRMLFEQAEAWVEAVNIPLIVPVSKCLPTSSPDLISSTNLNLYPSMQGNLVDRLGNCLLGSGDIGRYTKEAGVVIW